MGKKFRFRELRLTSLFSPALNFDKNFNLNLAQSSNSYKKDFITASKWQEVENVVTKEAVNNFPTHKPWRPPKLKRPKKKNGEGHEEKRFQTPSQKGKMVRKKTVVQMKRLMVSHSKERNLLSQSRSQNQKMKRNLKVLRD